VSLQELRIAKKRAEDELAVAQFEAQSLQKKMQLLAGNQSRVSLAFLQLTVVGRQAKQEVFGLSGKNQRAGVEFKQGKARNSRSRGAEQTAW
jgi:hypothetical protein